ncbi:MAG: glycosyltransferase [Rhodospirillales bacterium]|nr:glycosyltransferase [Rhodospirillales bacterium]
MSAPLVVFGEDWGAHPSSTQHLVRELAGSRAVVWVESIGLRRPRATLHDMRRAAQKLLAVARGGRSADRAEDGKADSRDMRLFHRLAPLAVPAASGRAARYLNRLLLGRAVRRALRRHRLERPILWISLPTAVDVIGSIGERAVVYYCGDDWGALDGVDHTPVCRCEAELQNKADVILAASPALAARFPPHKTVVVPHGVDLRRFGDRQPRAADFLAGTPVAGFFGSLSAWIDVPLIAAAAAALPDWRFLLIGPVRSDVSSLRALPNVDIVGPRPHAALPGYVQHWDVSLLPFRDTAQIRACNPLKLREYLAAGAPVVATDFPALDGYRDLVEVASTPEAFVAAIRRAGAEGRLRAAQRLVRVTDESWSVRARQVEEILAVW